MCTVYPWCYITVFESSNGDTISVCVYIYIYIYIYIWKCLCLDTCNTAVEQGRWWSAKRQSFWWQTRTSGYLRCPCVWLRNIHLLRFRWPFCCYRTCWAGSRRWAWLSLALIVNRTVCVCAVVILYVTGMTAHFTFFTCCITRFPCVLHQRRRYEWNHVFLLCSLSHRTVCYIYVCWSSSTCCWFFNFHECQFEEYCVSSPPNIYDNSSLYYTRWFMNYGHYCRRGFPSSLRLEKFIYTCVQFWSFTELRLLET